MKTKQASPFNPIPFSARRPAGALTLHAVNSPDWEIKQKMVRVGSGKIKAMAETAEVIYRELDGPALRRRKIPVIADAFIDLREIGREEWESLLRWKMLNGYGWVVKNFAFTVKDWFVHLAEKKLGPAYGRIRSDWDDNNHPEYPVPAPPRPPAQPPRILHITNPDRSLAEPRAPEPARYVSQEPWAEEWSQADWTTGAGTWAAGRG